MCTILKDKKSFPFFFFLYKVSYFFFFNYVPMCGYMRKNEAILGNGTQEPSQDECWELNLEPLQERNILASESLNRLSNPTPSPFFTY